MEASNVREFVRPWPMVNGKHMLSPSLRQTIFEKAPGTAAPQYRETLIGLHGLIFWELDNAWPETECSYRPVEHALSLGVDHIYNTVQELDAALGWYNQRHNRKAYRDLNERLRAQALRERGEGV